MSKTLKQHMPDRIKRVARMVGYAALLDDPDAWHGLTLAMTAHLDEKQRAAMAWAALRSLTPEQVVRVCEAVLPQGAGFPQPPLYGFVDQAAFWADMAAPDEIEAYCLASFNAMPSGRRRAFLDFVQGRRAA